MKNLLPSLLLVAAIALAPAAHAADAPTAPRTARVAGGAQVKLVSSARSAAQWMAARPRVRDMRPKARGNFD